MMPREIKQIREAVLVATFEAWKKDKEKRLFTPIYRLRDGRFLRPVRNVGPAEPALEGSEV